MLRVKTGIGDTARTMAGAGRTDLHSGSRTKPVRIREGKMFGLEPKLSLFFQIAEARLGSGHMPTFLGNT